MALTFADLDAKLPRSNTVTSNQRYILNLLDNRRTSQKDRTTAIAYVFANRKKFEPVNIGTVPYPLSEELDLKVNGPDSKQGFAEIISKRSAVWV